MFSVGRASFFRKTPDIKGISRTGKLIAPDDGNSTRNGRSILPPTDRTVNDRYVTFGGIDFEGNMEAVLTHLHRYIDDPAFANPFWDRFRQRLAVATEAERPVADRLLLMHAHVYYMAELFEDNDDAGALAALRRLEEECF
ncbi:MAG: hypothetical protein H6Q99_4078 [Proteobacteria bacterium]|nr:hypothetical protein [Pseudomonadota bacterium]